jgi:hypothetical protein
MEDIIEMQGFNRVINNIITDIANVHSRPTGCEDMIWSFVCVLDCQLIQF